MDNRVNIKKTMPLMVGYRTVRVIDDVSKKNILALYKVHLDSEGKVWGLVGQPLFLAETREQLNKSVVLYTEDLQEGMLQAQLMQDQAIKGGIYTRESFPELGARNPLSYMEPMTQNPDAIPNENENLDNVR